MAQLRVWAGVLAGVLSLIAFIPYIAAILRGKNKPNRASWWIWAVMGLVLGLSYYSSGADGTIWVPVSYFIGPLITAILSIKYGEGGWSKLDRACILAACASAIPWLVLSLFFHSQRAALPTLIIGLCIDFAGAIPTIRKVYREPAGEDRLAWSMFCLANILNVIAIDRWTLEIMIYPVYMMLACGCITMLVLWPRKKTERSNEKPVSQFTVNGQVLRREVQNKGIWPFRYRLVVLTISLDGSEMEGARKKVGGFYMFNVGEWTIPPEIQACASEDEVSSARVGASVQVTLQYDSLESQVWTRRKPISLIGVKQIDKDVGVYR